MQWRTALWISRAFCISFIAEIKAISDLIPIHLYLRKLYRRFLLRGSSFSPNHIISSILSSDRSYDHILHNISINNLISKQRLRLKSSLIDTDNRYNKLLFSFSYFNEELNLENWLIDFFSDQFSFHSCLSNIKSHKKSWWHYI